ncbi:MAG: hypothetical protein N3B01_03995 [Verrucomicrobiae bacterium]|nr:hypothetical protein [Verrucomicrobiae bacterium]
MISWVALAMVILAPVLYLAGRMGLEPMKIFLNAATLAWFVATPFWMERADGK